jgi:2-polyprenyl-6-methoxyphenol hydroxylase-like FAD-dependent oxidoreductase
MPTTKDPQVTDFTRDVFGRYICNGLDEAVQSMNPQRPDARPFNVIVLGAGTFGSALAQQLFFRDRAHSHRILVLEAGPFVLAEHVQNLPVLGLDVPKPAHLAALQAGNDPNDPKPRNEVWGLAGTHQLNSQAWRIALAAARCIGADGRHSFCLPKLLKQGRTRGQLT